MKPTIILTGCAGFIGSNFVNVISIKPEIKEQYNFLIIDTLTYAGVYKSIEKSIEENENLSFKKIDIRDASKVNELSGIENVRGIIHFAAESHVDNSIKNPNVFVETNVIGTLNLLNLSLNLREKNNDFRFLHVSTDEVYGSLSNDDSAFTEKTPIDPSSPYSSSKASSDLLVKAFNTTYSLNTVITRCSNNYGPYQFPEKLIPFMLSNAKKNKKLPVYGTGENVRDWIFVEDHNEGVWAAFNRGRTGEVYNLGGESEFKNIEIVKKILKILNKDESLIEFVEDRLGHDWRYAMNIEKAKEELDWKPGYNLEDGLAITIDWYNNNEEWLKEAVKRIENN